MAGSPRAPDPRRRAAILGATTALVLASCRDATAVRVHVYTDVAWDAGRRVVIAASTDGPPSHREPLAEVAGPWTETDLGDFVLLPGSAKDAPVRLALVMGITKDPSDCTIDAPDGCIFSRRRLRFLEYRTLTVPMNLYTACIGVPCTDDTTCNVLGQCVPADVAPEDCASPDGCPLPGEARPPSRLAPPDPLSASAAPISSSRIDLAWTSGGGTTTGYRVSYQAGPTAPPTCADGTRIPNVSGTSLSVMGLDASTQYTFRVCSVSADDPPSVSTGATATATTFGPDDCSPERLAASPYAGGDGSRGSPYLLCSVAQVAAIADRPLDWRSDFRLLADVDFADVSFAGIGTPTEPFRGRFFGAGHRIRNLGIAGPAGGPAGFFHSIALATIADVTFESSTVNAPNSSHVGLLAGHCDRSQITNLRILGASVHGYEAVGGIVGQAMDCNVFGAEVTATIVGTYRYVGGLVGVSWPGDYFDVRATVDVLSPQADFVGGAAGGNQDAAIHLQGVSIDGRVVGKDSVGGLVGANQDGTYIHRSRFAGSVTGLADVGGAVGYNGDPPFFIRSTSVDARVTGNARVGGLGGATYDRGEIADSHVKGTITGAGNNQRGFGAIWGNVDWHGAILRTYADVTIDSDSSATGGAFGDVTMWNSIYPIADSFVVASVRGSSAVADVSLFAGSNANAVTSVNSFYWTGGSCLNSGGGGCNVTAAQGEPDLTAFYDRTRQPLAAWDFTNVWIERTGAFPILNPNRSFVPSVSHACVTSVTGGSAYLCTPTISDADLNELRAIRLADDHSCRWLYGTSGAGTTPSLQGTPPPGEASTCVASFVVTDGVHTSAKQTFTITVTP